MTLTAEQLPSQADVAQSVVITPPVPEVTFTDPTFEDPYAQQSLTVNTIGAFEDIHAAAEGLGLSALAFAVRDRIAAREAGLKRGSYDPSTFLGQEAVAVRRVIEHGAGQYEDLGPDPFTPTLTPELTERMVALNAATTPRVLGVSALDSEWAKLMSPRPQSTAKFVVDKGTGWSDESYTAFHETDPKLMKLAAPTDTGKIHLTQRIKSKLLPRL